MNISVKQLLALTVIGLVSATVSFASPVAVTGTHGSVPAGSFTGTDIPVSDVMLDTFNGLTIALSAHERPPSAGPGAFGSNGAGTYFAAPGISTAGRATWNFDFYLSNTGIGGLAGYTYKLSYGSDASGLVSFDPLLIPDNAPTFTSVGNSENLGFAQFGTPIGYNLNANASYGFLLQAFEASDVGQLNAVAETAIVVNVGTVPDAGSTMALMGLALTGLAGVRRKFAA